MKEKAQKYLTNNPAVKQLYGTVDGFLFEKQHDANAHARTLEDKEVLVFARNVGVPNDEKTPTVEKDPKQNSPFDYESIDKKLLEDRAFLMVRYEALKGEKVPHNIGTAKLSERVQALERELFEDNSNN